MKSLRNREGLDNHRLDHVDQTDTDRSSCIYNIQLEIDSFTKSVFFFFVSSKNSQNLVLYVYITYTNIYYETENGFFDIWTKTYTLYISVDLKNKKF